MILDAGDLAMLEVDVENLEPLGRDVAKLLIGEIRRRDDEGEAALKALDAARDLAKDAEILIGHLLAFESIVSAPYEVDKKIDEINDLMLEIRELE